MGIGPLIDVAGKIIACPVKIASMLVHQYSTVFSTPKEPLKSPQEIFDDQEVGGGLLDFEFTEDDLIEAENAICMNEGMVCCNEIEIEERPFQSVEMSATYLNPLYLLGIVVPVLKVLRFIFYEREGFMILIQIEQESSDNLL